MLTYQELDTDNGVKGGVVKFELEYPEDQTIEVPLLIDSYDNEINQHSELEQYDFNGEPECCNRQPGFRAKLKGASAQEAKHKILLAIILCFIFMTIEFIGGYMAGSLAIMTDAAHLASDCVSFVIAIVAIWVGGRPPDGQMSFGYKRFEVIGALSSILGIWLLTTLLVVLAVQRIYSQDFELDVEMMMVISGIGIGINIIMMLVLHGSWTQSDIRHGHSHNHGSSRSHLDSYSFPAVSSESLVMTAAEKSSKITEQNLSGRNIVIKTSRKPLQKSGLTKTQLPHVEKNFNLRAAMLHVIGDLVQSIGVFLAAILIKFYPNAKYADPLCTLLFSIIVILTTVQLFRESIAILVNAVPQNLNLRTLHYELSSLKGVRSVHHLNVWQQATQQTVMMVHLAIYSRTDSTEVLEAATELISGPKYNIDHATIQIEQENTILP
ncbi:zinc transporter 2 isoform X2 [Drosophila eugracilis]|nr:zinc transporter 2 isoform X2 [Drosophila eugracilis]XP_041674422.1 zinc transporter 2 isoform X2 [Drosophila eugracilis]XP_041674423.1 zinc transporter 2 isoform X2 [Drosophila eugracilis]XP_041674424.1 zinc transporter 2 isoform X2 [Drosophila eugracilis]